MWATICISVDFYTGHITWRFYLYHEMITYCVCSSVTMMSTVGLYLSQGCHQSGLEVWFTYEKLLMAVLARCSGGGMRGSTLLAGRFFFICYELFVCIPKLVKFFPAPGKAQTNLPKCAHSLPLLACLPSSLTCFTLVFASG